MCDKSNDKDANLGNYLRIISVYLQITILVKNFHINHMNLKIVQQKIYFFSLNNERLG